MLLLKPTVQPEDYTTILDMACVERTLIRASSSMSSSSPKYSFTKELTPPPYSSDPTFRNIQDRLNQIDSRVHDLRATVLTTDSYVDRRNREDDSIRREFNSHHQISERIEGHVGRVQVDVNQLKTDIDHLRTEIGQLKSSINELGSGSGLLHDHVDRLQNNVCQLQVDMAQLQTDVRGVRTDISQIQTIASQLRTDFMVLQRDTSRHFGEVFSRFSVMESRMKHMERIRFNSLAHTLHAPITRVPHIEDDGTVRWPEYFPQTVWKFWCLKKRSRVKRLVELAEFYELEGYQYWGRMHQSQADIFTCDSDSSDSSDLPSNLTRSEAAAQYPEACHQALAATLGLVYYNIRKEVEGTSRPRLVPTSPQKRSQDDMISTTSPSKPKRPRRSGDISPTMLHKLVTGPSIESKSAVSEDWDKLGWNVQSSHISEDGLNKLKGLSADDVNALLLRALEHGHVKLKPSRSERSKMSPAGSARMSVRTRNNAAQEDETATIANTVPTEIIASQQSDDSLQMHDASEADSPDT